MSGLGTINTNISILIVTVYHIHIITRKHRSKLILSYFSSIQNNRRNLSISVSVLFTENNFNTAIIFTSITGLLILCFISAKHAHLTKVRADNTFFAYYNRDLRFDFKFGMKVIAQFY